MTTRDDHELQDLHGEPDDEERDGREAVLRHLDRLMAGRVAQAVDHHQERVLRASIVPGWQQSGTCGSADPEAWFPDAAGLVNPVVRGICAECPVRRSCLATAVLFAEDGTWAGTSLGERRPAYRALREGADPASVLDELLAHQKAHSQRKTHFKTQRWSGRPTSVSHGQDRHSDADGSRGQVVDQRCNEQTRPRCEQGPEAA